MKKLRKIQHFLLVTLLCIFTAPCTIFANETPSKNIKTADFVQLAKDAQIEFEYLGQKNYTAKKLKNRNITPIIYSHGWGDVKDNPVLQEHFRKEQNYCLVSFWYKDTTAPKNLIDYPKIEDLSTNFGQETDMAYLKKAIDEAYAITGKKVILYGYSRGAATIINLMGDPTLKDELKDKVQLIVLLGALVDLKETIAHKIEIQLKTKKRLRLIPFKHYCATKISNIAYPFIPVLFRKYNIIGPKPIKRCTNIDKNIPILIFHSQKDDITPFKAVEKMVQKLKDNGNNNVSFEILKKAKHNTYDTDNKFQIWNKFRQKLHSPLLKQDPTIVDFQRFCAQEIQKQIIKDCNSEITFYNKVACLLANQNYNIDLLEKNIKNYPEEYLRCIFGDKETKESITTKISKLATNLEATYTQNYSLDEYIKTQPQEEENPSDKKPLTTEEAENKRQTYYSAYINGLQNTQSLDVEDYTVDANFYKKLLTILRTYHFNTDLFLKDFKLLSKDNMQIFLGRISVDKNTIINKLESLFKDIATNYQNCCPLDWNNGTIDKLNAAFAKGKFNKPESHYNSRHSRTSSSIDCG